MLPLVLIGPMGAGKTRVGRRVAHVLGVPFIDTDAEIVTGHGPIRVIFETRGEAHFRGLEREVVAAALGKAAVVSLGGGAVLDAESRTALARCTVVYLSVSARAVAARLGGGGRPLVDQGIADWTRIYAERRPLYEALASVRFDTSRHPPDVIADDVVTWVRKRS